jgi:hypothetical protein
LSRTMMEAVCTSETSVHFNEIVWLYFPEDCHLHTRHSVQTLSFALKILSNVGVLKLTLECTGWISQIQRLVVVEIAEWWHYLWSSAFRYLQIWP